MYNFYFPDLSTFSVRYEGKRLKRTFVVVMKHLIEFDENKLFRLSGLLSFFLFLEKEYQVFVYRFAFQLKS